MNNWLMCCFVAFFINRILFGLSFFFCRLIVGSFVTKECIEAYFGWRDIDISCVGHKIFTFVILVNILFHLLNLYWFWLIVKAAIWGKTKRKSSESRKRRKSKILSSNSIKVKSKTSSSTSTDPNKHKNGTSTEKLDEMNK